jgi:uncharacterized membrane protein
VAKTIQKIEGPSNLVIVEETPEELTHRLEQEAADKALKRRRDISTYYVALGFLVIVALASTITAFVPLGLDPSLVTFGRDVFKILAAGVIGYVLGKAN